MSLRDRSKFRDWSRPEPLLDIRKVLHPLDQVSYLGCGCQEGRGGVLRAEEEEVDISQGESIPHQELPPSRHQALLYVGQHGQDGGLVQRSDSLCFLYRICFKMCFDGNTNHILNGVNNFINLCTFQVILALQSKLSCQEPLKD